MNFFSFILHKTQIQNIMILIVENKTSGRINMPNDKPYIKLTKTEHLILNSYKKMILSLGEYLGEGYEIILHSLENLQHSVIENVNGHYSGRKNGAPITDLALSMLSQLKEEPSQSAVCYMNHSKKGVPLRSCTIPITGEKERIIGLICINFYTDVPLSSLLAKFYPQTLTSLSVNDSATENFADNTDELIENVLYKIQHQVLNDFAVSPQNKNKEIIAQLYQRGIFNIKDAVIKVASLLEISKNTVYMHLRNLKDQEK